MHLSPSGLVSDDVAGTGDLGMSAIIDFLSVTWTKRPRHPLRKEGAAFYLQVPHDLGHAARRRVISSPLIPAAGKP